MMTKSFKLVKKKCPEGSISDAVSIRKKEKCCALRDDSLLDTWSFRPCQESGQQRNNLLLHGSFNNTRIQKRLTGLRLHSRQIKPAKSF